MGSWSPYILNMIFSQYERSVKSGRDEVVCFDEEFKEKDKQKRRQAFHKKMISQIQAIFYDL